MISNRRNVSHLACSLYEYCRIREICQFPEIVDRFSILSGWFFWTACSAFLWSWSRRPRRNGSIFVGLIVSRVLYALLAWGVFASVGQSGRIEAFLKHAYKFGFSKYIITFNELLTKSGSSLFLKMQSSVHCLNYLLPPKKRSRLTNLETAIAATFFHSAILVFLSAHSLTGDFSCCNFYTL